MIAAVMAAYQIASSMQMAELTRGQAKLSKRVADMNADAQDLDAWQAEADGYTESARYATTMSNILADQRVAFAARGVAVDSGIGKELQNESRLSGFLNTLDIQNQAHSRALGFKNQARNTRLGAYLETAKASAVASAQQTAGIMSAAGTLASGYARSSSGVKGNTSDKISSGDRIGYDYDSNKVTINRS